MNKLIHLDSGSISGKAFILSQVKINNNIDINEEQGLTKVNFDVESISTNDISIMDIDKDMDILLKEDSEPGYSIDISVEVYDGNLTESIYCYECEGNIDQIIPLEVEFYIIDKNKTLGNIGSIKLKTMINETGIRYTQMDRSKRVILLNDNNDEFNKLFNRTFTYPSGIEVYYKVKNGKGFIHNLTLSCASLFTK